MNKPHVDSIPLARPAIGEEEIASVARVLRSGALVQGVEVAALEEEFRRRTGAAEAVAVANGTMALELALRALDIGPGDEVIVPAFSFMATANAVENRGATPVFVDVEPHTWNMDPALAAAAITPRTRALLPVHEFGLCCAVRELRSLADAHRIVLLEDAACAIGSERDGLHAGRSGVLGAFSLHPRKVITSGEGGIVVTDDPELARSLRIFRNHGIAPGSTPPVFVAAGTNARMTDFQAALALPQLRRLDESVALRTRIAHMYLDGIRIQGAQLPAVPAGVRPNWQTFHLVLPHTIPRDAAIARLASTGIGTNAGAQCMPAQPYYRNKYAFDAASRFPNAWNAWKQGLAIPLFESLKDEQVDRVIRELNRLS